MRAKRRAALAKLDTLTQSLFLEMFGDPASNPKRWPTRSLGDLLTLHQYGPRFYNEAYTISGVRIIRITDLDQQGNLSFSTMPRLEVNESDRDKYILRPGEIIFARTGATVGKLALIREDDPPCIAGAYFIRLRFQESEITPTYAKHALASPSLQAVIATQSRQAAQQNFSGPALRRLLIPLPPLLLQHAFAESMRRVASVEGSMNSSVDKTEHLFHSLQHRAFRGEL